MLTSDFLSTFGKCTDLISSQHAQNNHTIKSLLKSNPLLLQSLRIDKFPIDLSPLRILGNLFQAGTLLLESFFERSHALTDGIWILGKHFGRATKYAFDRNLRDRVIFAWLNNGHSSLALFPFVGRLTSWSTVPCRNKCSGSGCGPSCGG